jgi:hypothetical protein
MHDSAMASRTSDGKLPERRPLVDEQLADELLGKAQGAGRGDDRPPGLGETWPGRAGSGNSRNGTTGKTVLADVGAVDLAVPRDPQRHVRAADRAQGSDPPGGVQRPVVAVYARER